MSPEERKLLQDTAKKLDNFLNVYYKLNFPNVEIMEKSLDVKENLTIGKTLKYGAVYNQQPAITAPTGGITIDNEARVAINSILSVLQALKLTQ